MWYVIQTKPKKEDEAQSYLAMRGLEIFNPLMETFSQRNGKLNKALKPLFPSYIFGNFEWEKDYTLIKWARGVKKIVGFGGSTMPISEEVIYEIKNRTNDNGIVKRTFDLKPNDRVRIKFGPLRDLLGIFEKWVPEKERVRILLNLIGFQPQVDLHYSMVEKVG